MKISHEELRARQSLPLSIKESLSIQAIEVWIDSFGGMVYTAFSGGKDSTVLRDLVRRVDLSIPSVFVSTGLQYPEVRKFALSREGVTELRPAKSFGEVIENYGWPVVSKKVARFVYDIQNASPRNKATVNLRLTGMTRAGQYRPSMELPRKWRFLIDAPFKVSSYCCDVMKKNPLHKYARRTGRVPIIGTMASDSNRRERDYKRYGCLRYETAEPSCTPLGFWTEKDILAYLCKNKLEYASVYGEIAKRGDDYSTTGERHTGCIFCAFGVQYDGTPNRFQRLRITHPKLWDYCINFLGEGAVLDYMGVPYQ